MMNILGRPRVIQKQTSNVLISFTGSRVVFQQIPTTHTSTTKMKANPQHTPRCITTFIHCFLNYLRLH